VLSSLGVLAVSRVAVQAAQHTRPQAAQRCPVGTPFTGPLRFSAACQQRREVVALRRTQWAGPVWSDRFVRARRTAVSVEGEQLEGGISPPQEGAEWHILGHTYWNRAWCESTFAFETLDPPGTFVPPHVHPTQDEFIAILEGELEVELDGQRHKASA